MKTVRLECVRIAGVASCVPATAEDCLARCTALYGDAERAAGVVRTTGILSRRVLAPGETSLDLSVRAAEDVLAATRTTADEIGAIVSVTFTPDRLMPCTACQAQARLGLPSDVLAFDLSLACSGWPYGVYVAGLLVRSLGRKVLLLDGDAQTPRLDPADAATVPLLADAGTATLLEPTDDADHPFTFAFLSDGAKGDALQLPFGGTISMDGFSVFKFVTTDVLRFIRGFLDETRKTAETFDAFIPHQANMFMVERISKKLGFDHRKLRISGDKLGNSSSASIPTTIAFTETRGTLLVAGFGGGLSAAAAEIFIDGDCPLTNIEVR